MGEHTPGPWKWWTSNSWRRLRHDAGRGKTVSVLEPTTSPSDGHPDCIISDEDMALIEAAPDLLAALKTVELHLEGSQVAYELVVPADDVLSGAVKAKRHMYPTLLQVIEAAIAKAEGRQ